MTDDAGRLRDPLRKLGALALAVAALGAAASAWGFVEARERFFQGWLVGFLFWIALPLGSLALLMLHQLTGGSWGTAIQGLLRAAARTLPLFVPLFLGIALGIPTLYEWSHEDALAADPLLRQKSAYLNTGGFLIRALVCFATWIGLAVALERTLARADRGEDVGRRARTLSGPGLALYGLAMTFASVDWAMSLEPHWFSTIYGVVFIVGQVLATLGFTILVASRISRREGLERWMPFDVYHDLGKLLFAFTLLWAYVNYSQFLIIWSGNLAEETPWYIRRIEPGWRALAISLIALHFALPFLVLLSRRVKRNPLAIGAIAAFLVAMRYVDLLWTVVPGFGEHVTLHWMHFAPALAIGGLWLAAYSRSLARGPLRSRAAAPAEVPVDVHASTERP
jgi:hypothetical protein